MNFIRIRATSCAIYARKESKKSFVPSVLLANVVSLARKIDEVRHVVQYANI